MGDMFMDWVVQFTEKKQGEDRQMFLRTLKKHPKEIERDFRSHMIGYAAGFGLATGISVTVTPADSKQIVEFYRQHFAKELKAIK